MLEGQTLLLSLACTLERKSLVHLDPLDESGYEKDLLRQYGEVVGVRIIAEAPVAGEESGQPRPAGSHSRWLYGLRIPTNSPITRERTRLTAGQQVRRCGERRRKVLAYLTYG